MNSYEARRLEKIKKNQALLAQLNIKSVVPAQRQTRNHDGNPPTKKRRIAKPDPLPPSRVSARIAATPVKPIYNDEPDIKATALRRTTGAAKQAAYAAAQAKKELGLKSEEQDTQSLVSSKDVEQIREGWTSSKPTASGPSRDENQVFHFEDYPDFVPNKSPEEMLREGCFGGSYYRPLRSRRLGIVVQDDWKELPKEWIQGLNVERYLTSPDYDSDVNKYKVSCGQSIEEWEASGWINHQYDVRGWFQWYTRFFLGRRCDDDDRQISRWKKCVGATGRWRRALLKKYKQLGVREVFDDGADEDAPEVSPVIHQTCHHWAFEVRQEHLDEIWAGGG